MNHIKDTVIIGAGLSGLVVGHALKQLDPHHRLMIVEKSGKCGGVIQSFQDKGFTAEWGPHGFLDNSETSRRLITQLGLNNELAKAPLATHGRYVCRNGALQLIPQSPLKILRAPLISWREKIGVLRDLFKKPLAGEPTVAKWANHRFGPALLPYVDAVFTGTYAGDYNELKIDAVMPGVRALEKRYRSVIRGALATAWQARKRHKTRPSLPTMLSFTGGMQRLVERLADQFIPGEELILHRTVSSIARVEDQWQVRSLEDEPITGANLVIALPVNQSLGLLATLSDSMPVRRVPEAWLATVVLGFAGARLPPGFGFLAPECENRFILGALFSSNMFAGRAPANHIIVEALVGGRRHPERLELTDDELIAGALGDIGDLLNISDSPVFARVLRPGGGIPQLEAGYPALLSWRDTLVEEMGSLAVCGFGWEGIGINDMVRTATDVADKIFERRTRASTQPELKKVYF